MERRWETSSRPLFVKTVWDNGHRHVILGNEDPLAKLNAPKKTRSRKSSIANEDSARIPSEPEENFNGDDLRITKMNYILITNQNEPKTCTCQRPLVENLAINAPISEFKESDLDDSPKNNFNLNVVQIKANVFRNDNLWSPHVTCKNDGSDSLSERVLLWLDLTAEKFEIAPKVKNEEVKKRAVTAKLCPNVRPNRRPSTHVKQSKPTSAPKETLSVKDHEDSEDTNIVSQIEVNDCVKIESKKIKFDNSKRQLHIFLPNILKRNNDCDSTLSSKSGSLINKGTAK